MKNRFTLQKKTWNVRSFSHHMPFSPFFKSHPRWPSNCVCIGFCPSMLQYCWPAQQAVASRRSWATWITWPGLAVKMAVNLPLKKGDEHPFTSWLVVSNMTFIFHYMGQSFPLTFIFFKMVKTTNQPAILVSTSGTGFWPPYGFVW